MESNVEYNRKPLAIGEISIQFPRKIAFSLFPYKFYIHYFH